MRQTLGSLSWRSAWAFAPVLSALPIPRSLVVVLTPAPPRSLGDEAIIRGLLNGLDKDPGSLRFIESSSTKAGYGWASVLVVGIQGPALSSRVSGLAHLSLLVRASDVYVLGADVLDGHYSIELSRRRIEFARLAERAGAAVSIVSYSLNESPGPQARQALAKVPPTVRLVARDPLSAARTFEFAGRDAVLGADLAFLATGREQAQPSSVRDGSLCFVPNAALSAWCGGYENLVNIVAGAVQALLESPSVLSVELMPHDLRSACTTGDIALCRSVTEVLHHESDRLAMRVPHDALHARAILGSAEVVLTARMHAAVGALCESRPLLLFGYQGKAEGLLDAFGLGEQLLSPSALGDYHSLRSSVEATFERSEILHGVIASRLPEVRERAFLNFREPS